jgi:hypothetical protein
MNSNYFYKSINYTFNTIKPDKNHYIWNIGNSIKYPLDNEIIIDLSYWRIHNNILYGIINANDDEIAYVQLLAIQNNYQTYLVDYNGNKKLINYNINKTYDILIYLYQKWLNENINYYYNIDDNKKYIRNNKNEYIKNINFFKWISPNRLKNYILGSPLNDWIELYKPKFKKMDVIDDALSLKIIKDSIEFEYSLYEKIKNLNYKTIQIIDNFKDSINFNNYLKTIIAIKNNIPIIYQGVLYNCINKTYGIPDLLIRGDIIQEIFNCDIIPNKTKYYVIDIKNAKLKINSSSGEILNSSKLTKFYRVQLYIYNEALGFIQGYFPEFSFLLGKLNNNNDPFKSDKLKNTTLGIIYFNIDIINNYNLSVKWIKNLYKNGNNWDPLKPDIIELIPNLKYNYESKAITRYKYQLNKKLPCISELWNCTYNQQKIAFKNGIKDWKNQVCSSKDLGFNEETNNSKILDLIIKMNQSYKLFKNNFPSKIVNSGIYLEKIKTKLPNYKYEFYLDFEFQLENSEQFIFMIGLGYIENDNFKYISYIADDLSHNSEKICLIRMFHDIYKIVNNESYLFIHWGNIENYILYKKIKQLNLRNELNLLINVLDFQMFDLNLYFKSESIIVRNALNFKLKSIGNAFYNLNYIKTIWDKNITGENITYFINNYYNNEINNEINDNKINQIENNIIYYNYSDVKILQEILYWLRKNIK